MFFTFIPISGESFDSNLVLCRSNNKWSGWMILQVGWSRYYSSFIRSQSWLDRWSILLNFLLFCICNMDSTILRLRFFDLAEDVTRFLNNKQEVNAPSEHDKLVNSSLSKVTEIPWMLLISGIFTYYKYCFIFYFEISYLIVRDV